MAWVVVQVGGVAAAAEAHHARTEQDLGQACVGIHGRQCLGASHFEVDLLSSTIYEVPSGTSWLNRDDNKATGNYMAHRAVEGLIMWLVGRGTRHPFVGLLGVRVVEVVIGGLGLDLVDWW